jgi:hypothetical protein
LPNEHDDTSFAHWSGLSIKTSFLWLSAAPFCIFETAAIALWAITGGEIYFDFYDAS